MLWAAFVLCAVASAYFFYPRPGRLNDFDPRAMAQLETRMWQDYYARNSFSLCGGLYSIGREQFHVSPWDSVRLAWQAGRAAIIFKDSRTRTESEPALPFLTAYYAIVQQRAQPALAAERTAKLELEWWQARREKATPAQVAALIAELYGQLFQVRNAGIETAAQLRVEAMGYRDQRGFRALTTEEWASIRAKLIDSYTRLSQSVNGQPPHVAAKE